MLLTKPMAMYFWHRHLEGADPETRTLRKWNAAYPDEQVTLEDITGFLSEMERLKASGLTDYYSMEAILTPGPPKLDVITTIKKKIGKR
jgi:hypothetical protein